MNEKDKLDNIPFEIQKMAFKYATVFLSDSVAELKLMLENGNHTEQLKKPLEDLLNQYERELVIFEEYEDLFSI